MQDMAGNLPTEVNRRSKNKFEPFLLTQDELFVEHQVNLPFQETLSRALAIQ